MIDSPEQYGFMTLVLVLVVAGVFVLHQIRGLRVRARLLKDRVQRGQEELLGVQSQLSGVESELMKASRFAGSAEVATGVLHNVGNVLNSIGVSASMVTSRMQASKLTDMVRVMELLDEQGDDVGSFLADNPKGKNVLPYLEKVIQLLVEERAENLTELRILVEHLNHIKTVIQVQQGYARTSNGLEELKLGDVLEDAVQIHGAGFQKRGIEIVREYGDVPAVIADKHQVMQIVVNLVKNAQQAVASHRTEGGCVTLRILGAGDHRVRIEVCDNGVGIPEENLGRVFNHGFTTKKDGHGFGLHRSHEVAEELGGELTVDSAGAGKGATFGLELPVAVQAPEVSVAELVTDEVREEVV